MTTSSRQAASFRDPNGFLFNHGGRLYRQVNPAYQRHYDALMSSGLYAELTRRGWLVSHEEATLQQEGAYKVLAPQVLPFISYPYEWSFTQLRDAAQLTLRIQQVALQHGMTLKDASAYNIQFSLENGRPILIDTLSFEIYEEGQPWVAYRQFCQHFLAPLALMHYKDVRLSQLMRVYIDGIPLDLAAELLPIRSRFKLSLATHIHAHAAAQKRYAGKAVTSDQNARMTKNALLGLVDNLEQVVKGLRWRPAGTEWGEYYDDTNYTDSAMQGKVGLVQNYINKAKPGMVWDLGGNTGRFSRIASGQGIPTICFDIDPAAVEKNYLDVRKAKEANLLPLLLDLTNPSAGLGWANTERETIGGRAQPELLLALALIHHLGISNNVPLEMVAQYFSSLAPWLVIEFVPKSDSQVQRLLASREDIFPDYTVPGFEAAFTQHYTIDSIEDVPGTERKLYLMRRK